MSKHWCSGAGQAGCLFDYGPNAHTSKAAAIADLVWWADNSELKAADLAAMRRDLRTQGIHYFPPKVRELVGVDYCELSLQPGPCPDGES